VYLFIFEKQKDRVTLVLGTDALATALYKRRGSRHTPGNDPSQNSRRLLL